MHLHRARGKNVVGLFVECCQTHAAEWHPQQTSNYQDYPILRLFPKPFHTEILHRVSQCECPRQANQSLLQISVVQNPWLRHSK